MFERIHLWILRHSSPFLTTFFRKSASFTFSDVLGYRVVFGHINVLSICSDFPRVFPNSERPYAFHLLAPSSGCPARAAWTRVRNPARLRCLSHTQTLPLAPLTVPTPASCPAGFCLWRLEAKVSSAVCVPAASGTGVLRGICSIGRPRPQILLDQGSLAASQTCNNPGFTPIS